MTELDGHIVFDNVDGQDVVRSFKDTDSLDHFLEKQRRCGGDIS